MSIESTTDTADGVSALAMARAIAAMDAIPDRDLDLFQTDWQRAHGPEYNYHRQVSLRRAMLVNLVTNVIKGEPYRPSAF